MESAADLFRPTDRVELVTLRARPGWPDATLYRYHVLLEQRSSSDSTIVFLIDADMRSSRPSGRRSSPR